MVDRDRRRFVVSNGLVVRREVLRNYLHGRMANADNGGSGYPLPSLQTIARAGMHIDCDRCGRGAGIREVGGATTCEHCRGENPDEKSRRQKCRDCGGWFDLTIPRYRCDDDDIFCADCGGDYARKIDDD